MADLRMKLNTNNEIKVKMKANDSISMKFDDYQKFKEEDPIFKDSPAYTITYNDINSWNNKSDFSGNYNDLTNKPNLNQYATIDFVNSGLSNKVDKESGMGLSQNSFTTEEKNKLASLENYDDTAIVEALSEKADISDIPTLTSDLENDSGFITKDVDDLTYYPTNDSVNSIVSQKQNIINSDNMLSADLVDDTSTTNKFVTASDITAWNNKSDFSGNYNDLTNKPTLSTVATSGSYNDLSNKPTIPTLDSAVSTSSTNGVQNQAITNYVDGKFTITTGTGTMSTTLVRSTETNQYIRSGNVITFTFVFTAEAGWDNTSTLVSNLPTPKAGMRFLGLNGSTNVPLRFGLNTSGELKNWYSYTKPSGGQVVEVTGTYITTD